MSFGATATEEYGASPETAHVVEEIGAYYEARGLIMNGEAPPLKEVCSCGHECWVGVAEENLPKAAEAGLSLPWIGPGYLDQRIAILAINFVAYGGLWANWQNKRWQLKDLENGEKKVDKSDFAYAIAAYAHATRAWQAGTPLSDDALPAPETAAESLKACAFLQSVKCSPRSTRSIPTEAMTYNCPREYLTAELTLLAPRVLIVLGDMPADRLRALHRTDAWENTRALDRGRLSLDEAPVTVLRCYHPGNWSRWRNSYRALVAAAGGGPLAA